MEWEEKEIIYHGFAYHGFVIWVGKRREGDWLASVSALPERGAMYVAGPGEGHILGPSESRNAAVNAAKEYVDERQRQRRQ